MTTCKCKWLTWNLTRYLSWLTQLGTFFLTDLRLVLVDWKLVLIYSNLDLRLIFTDLRIVLILQLDLDLWISIYGAGSRDVSCMIHSRLIVHFLCSFNVVETKQKPPLPCSYKQIFRPHWQTLPLSCGCVSKHSGNSTYQLTPTVFNTEVQIKPHTHVTTAGLIIRAESD